MERIFAVSPGGRRPRPPPRLPLDRYAREREGASGRRPAPPGAHRELPGRERREGTDDRRASTARATAPTARSGAASSSSGDYGLRARRTLCCRSLPGGAAAIREPWRMACAWPAAALRRPGRRTARGARGRGRADRDGASSARLPLGIGSPASASPGRLFDAVGALCGPGGGSPRGPGGGGAGGGVRTPPGGRAATRWSAYGGASVLDPREKVRAVLRRPRSAGGGRSGCRALPRGARAGDRRSLCHAAAARRRLGAVVLSGGVFQNGRLLARTEWRCKPACGR